jgi:hypothetical protein
MRVAHKVSDPSIRPITLHHHKLAVMSGMTTHGLHQLLIVGVVDKHIRICSKSVQTTLQNLGLLRVKSFAYESGEVCYGFHLGWCQWWLLTYCWSAVLHTAMTAATKPLAFTLTSLTVQMATPARTTMMLNFVSLEYPMLSNKTSNKQETGIILSFAICIIVIIIVIVIKPQCPRPQFNN